MDEDEQIRFLAHWAGIILAGLSFLGSWIYCISEYGYLLGFGLGWLPSIILSAITYAVVRFLWLLILLGICIFWYLASS